MRDRVGHAHLGQLKKKPYALKYTQTLVIIFYKSTGFSAISSFLKEKMQRMITEYSIIPIYVLKDDDADTISLKMTALQVYAYKIFFVVIELL